MNIRRLAIVAIVAWVAVAYGFRYHDHRPIGTTVYARATAQGGPWAHIAWIEGPTRLSPHGHLVVARVRVDTLPNRHAFRPVPGDASQCRLWLEESRHDVQAVASCPGAAPIRLTADGNTLPALGPENRPTLLYNLYPLTSFKPDRVIDSIRPCDPVKGHPVLALLSVLAFLPLFLLGARSLRDARALDSQPPTESDLPGDPAHRVRRTARHALALAAAGLALALLFSAGLV